MARSWLAALVALILAVFASAEPRKLLQAASQAGIQQAQQQLNQVQQQVIQTQQQTAITPACQNAVNNAMNAVNQANSNQAQIASAQAGNQAAMQQWSQGAAPWPYHSWPQTQTGASDLDDINAINAQIAAYQQLQQAYGQC